MTEKTPTDGWIQDGTLLYRLTDDPRPANRDEIHITMADGSRTIEARSRRALELLERIRSKPAGAGVPWENFPAYLIDNCEGDVITEEGLQHALAAMLSNPQYSAPQPAQAPAVVGEPVHQVLMDRFWGDVAAEDLWRYKATDGWKIRTLYTTPQSAPAPTPQTDRAPSPYKWQKLLQDLEWAAGGYNRTGDGESMCPCCEQWKSEGHTSSCRLAAMISDAPQADSQPVSLCVICGSDEPFTGTCGSSDLRALCKQPAPEPAQLPVETIDVAKLIAAAQAFVLDPTSLQKKIHLEAQAWGAAERLHAASKQTGQSGK